MIYSWGGHCRKCGNFRPEPESTVTGFRVFGFGERSGGTTPPKKIQEGGATGTEQPEPTTASLSHEGSPAGGTIPIKEITQGGGTANSPAILGIGDDDDSYEPEGTNDAPDDPDDYYGGVLDGTGVSHHRVNAKRLTDAIPDALALLPQEGGMIVIRSPQETGKTHLAAQVARELLRRFPADAQVAPTHRVALVRDLARRLGYTSYDIDPTAQCVATTLDSICRVPTYKTDKAGHMKDREFSLVVLDEATQVFRHLVGGTIGRDAPKVIRHLQVILRQAKYVLVMERVVTTKCILQHGLE